MPITKQRILLVGPFPPPLVGWSHVVDALANSQLRETYDLRHYNTMLQSSTIRNSAVDSALKSLRQIREFEQVLVREQPELALIFVGPSRSFWRDLMFMRQCHRHHIPFILRLFGGVATDWILKLHPVLRRISLSQICHANAILSETHHMNEDWQKLCPGTPTYRISNFVHVDWLPTSPTLTQVPDTINFVYLGNITKSKGVEIILESVDRICDSVSATFHFVGGEKESGYLEMFRVQASQLRHANSVHIHGYMERNDVYSLLAQCHVFLFPTQWPGEGQPAALLEAMGIGLVPIVTDWRGVGEIVKHDLNGLKIAPDATALVAATKRLREEPGLYLRLSHQARQTVADEYSEVAAIEQYHTIFSKSAPI